MKIFDLHQDLLTHLRFGEQFGQLPQTSFESIASSQIDLMVATAFPCPPQNDHYHDSVPDLITEELELYQDFLHKYPDWKLVLSADDLLSSNQKILLHIEGLNVFDGSTESWDQFKRWQQLGVRSVGTHWNVENKLGGGTLQPTVGLTELGREMISYLEEQHIIFDCAHMSRQSFFDAATQVTRPLYVSHGNANALCQNVRNYTDQQLQMIAETNGVIGVFLANTFVVGKDLVGTITDVVAHIDYIRNLIGIEHIAIGTDLGGIVSGGVEGLTHVDQLSNLESALLAADYVEQDIEKIFYQNASRVLRSHLSEGVVEI